MEREEHSAARGVRVERSGPGEAEVGGAGEGGVRGGEPLGSISEVQKEGWVRLRRERV